jgi:hypothetical protein
MRPCHLEQVSYELFSPLSLNYEAVQKSILEFFLENWVSSVLCFNLAHLELY